MYDSKEDTLAHINAVQHYLYDCQYELRERGIHHDESKLQEPEKSVFDAVTPKLRALSYGSAEYKASLREMGTALEHHYQHNSHHPEHYKVWSCWCCEKVFQHSETQVSSVLEGEIRLCPECCKHGTIMECVLEPASGVYGMDLLDVLEMLCDWKAATARHADGDILKSLEINRTRFGISDQLYHILKNTVQRMGWITPAAQPGTEGESV